ncbi:Uncharacterised protein [Vibrio cholerae]|nr:Uncharacterised protein [Vibrio cholerae]
MISPSKKRELAIRVSSVRVLIRVREEREDAGSLKAMWPSLPTPPMNRLILP